MKADVDRSCLILETGVNQRWRYGGWRPSPDSIAEAEGWEEAKQGLEGLHFLAVQPDPDRWGNRGWCRDGVLFELCVHTCTARVSWLFSFDDTL